MRSDAGARYSYATDATPMHSGMPSCVVLPGSTDELAAVLRNGTVVLSHPHVLSDASGPTLTNFAKDTTAPGAIVHTDGLQSYRVLAQHGYDHRRRTQTAAAPGEQLLPRAHRAISNLKAWMHGTHRGVSPEHLPVYLDEFVRHEALLDRAGCETSPLGCRSSPEKLRAA